MDGKEKVVDDIDDAPKERDFWGRFPAWAQKFIAISGWAAAALIWILHAPASINSFFAEAPKTTENVALWWNLDRSFTGSWSNEGNLELTDEDQRLVTLPGSPVALQLRVYGGKVDGFIVTDGLRKHWITSLAHIDGIKEKGEIKGNIFDFENGKRVILSKFHIKYTKSGDVEILHLAPLEQSMQFIPQEARLHRVSPDEMPSGDFDLLITLLSRTPQ